MYKHSSRSHLQLAYHIRVEQKYRVRVRHTARRAVPSPEQAAAHEYNKARLVKVREDIEEIKRALRTASGPRPLPPW
jgi:CRISPR/Cas system-associated exonuclease Cas4 (RecB family)